MADSTDAESGKVVSTQSASSTPSSEQASSTTLAPPAASETAPVSTSTSSAVEEKESASVSVIPSPSVSVTAASISNSQSETSVSTSVTTSTAASTAASTDAKSKVVSTKTQSNSLGFAPPEVRKSLDISGGVPVLSSLDVQKILDDNAQKLREWVEIKKDQEKGHISTEGKNRIQQLHKELSSAMAVLAELADQAGRVVQVNREKAVAGLPEWAVPDSVRERHKQWLGQADERAKQSQDMLKHLSSFFQLRSNPGLATTGYSAGGFSGYGYRGPHANPSYPASSMPTTTHSSPYSRLAPFGGSTGGRN